MADITSFSVPVHISGANVQLDAISEPIPAPVFDLLCNADASCSWSPGTVLGLADGSDVAEVVTAAEGSRLVSVKKDGVEQLPQG